MATRLGAAVKETLRAAVRRSVRSGGCAARIGAGMRRVKEWTAVFGGDAVLVWARMGCAWRLAGILATGAAARTTESTPVGEVQEVLDF